jgi:hypothetical protein
MIAISKSPAVAVLADTLTVTLRKMGKEVIEFEADGTGGPAMEAMILEGKIDFVFDFSLRELLHHRDRVGPDRLTAAAIRGVPQVIGLFDLAGSDAVLDPLGKEIAEKACAARGFTRIIIIPETPACLSQSLANWVYPPELLVETDLRSTVDLVDFFIRFAFGELPS